ncbi:hypothetical protein [Streptomyces sp. bgisy100]|uniref:hypothetical protein n=1 Tax=Streptomyces sp. bgisy100 TaxID=3413783 RepID=UPI003D73136A
MARRPLPRILTGAPLARSRAAARAAVHTAADVLHPLIVVVRGLRRLAAGGRRRLSAAPPDRRGPALVMLAAGVVALALLPYGPALMMAGVLAAGAWAGRDRDPAETGPSEAESGRLQVLHDALVPYFSATDDPGPLYAHGGDWQQAFSAWDFDDEGRITLLHLHYPPYFTDGEPAARARIEKLLHAKSGRGREYLFDWNEELNELVMTVLEPLPTDIRAQRFVTSPAETVLGFTDSGDVRRTVPVTTDDAPRDAPPVIWRTGPRTTEPHLLTLGRPGSGVSTLLRSLALQGLRHGDVLVVDGSGTGEYACLLGREGVLAVESGLAGALTSLEWAAHETERRLIAANRARQLGHPAPDDTRRQLWIVLDRPSVLSQVAAAEGRTDPQELLGIPLRHGRAAQVTVCVGDQLDCADLLADAVRSHTRARVILGTATAEEVTDVLDQPPHTTPPAHVPPGRGYARLGAGPVHRLQVPATPDPYDDEVSEADRQAVLDLLPDPAGPELPAQPAAAVHADS